MTFNTTVSEPTKGIVHNDRIDRVPGCFRIGKTMAISNLVFELMEMVNRIPMVMVSRNPIWMVNRIPISEELLYSFKKLYRREKVFSTSLTPAHPGAHQRCSARDHPLLPLGDEIGLQDGVFGKKRVFLWE